MAEYVPELLNELTRIVITTRNDNPSVEEYDAVVLPEWRRCDEIRATVQQDQAGLPSLAQMRTIYRSVLLMLRTKQVPEAEIAERLDEVFARCQNGLYPVDRAAVEAADSGDVISGRGQSVARDRAEPLQSAGLGGGQPFQGQ
jgi:hypothetical protein